MMLWTTIIFLFNFIVVKVSNAVSKEFKDTVDIAHFNSCCGHSRYCPLQSCCHGFLLDVPISIHVVMDTVDIAHFQFMCHGHGRYCPFFNSFVMDTVDIAHFQFMLSLDTMNVHFIPCCHGHDRYCHFNSCCYGHI
jgi:hypothetical protein